MPADDPLRAEKLWMAIAILLRKRMQLSKIT
jgi:hypothetical protein